MNLLLVLGSALWLGVLTSVSPCPLATNLAATACLSRRVESRRRAVVAIASYTLGRVAAYGLVAALLAFGFAGAPAVSRFLQHWLPPLLGPVLILAAMVLLGLIPLPFRASLASQARAEKLASRGVGGAFALGFLFALSFCPVSAALFFGSLVPLALGSGAVALTVGFYGAGTAAPVAGFALLTIASARLASKVVGGMAKAQPHILRITGIALLMAGLYLTARNTLGFGG